MNSDRSDHAGPLPRFDSQRQRQTNLMRQSTDEDRLTPRSSRSASERDDFSSGMNMLSTMRHPMNENTASGLKTMKRGDSFENVQRTGTPTKLNNNRLPSHSQQQQQRRGRYDEEDIDEEHSSRSRSGGGAVGRSSEQLWNNRSSNFTRDQGSLSPKNSRRFEDRVTDTRQRSPVDEREQANTRFNDPGKLTLLASTSLLRKLSLKFRISNLKITNLISVFYKK